MWPRWPSVTMGEKKDNELFQTHVQRQWQGCIHNSKLKAITWKDHFPPPFIDLLVARSAGYSYYCVFDGYSSYNHVQRRWQGCIHNSKLKAITRKDHFPPPFIDSLVARSAGYSYYCVFDGYSNYNHVTLDPGKQENTTLTSVLGAFAYYHMSSRSCNALTIKILLKDCKLSALGRQPIVTFSFCCHLIWFSYFVFVVIVFFRKSTYSSSLGERSPTLHLTYTAHLVLYPDTLGTMCHFSLGVG